MAPPSAPPWLLSSARRPAPARPGVAWRTTRRRGQAATGGEAGPDGRGHRQEAGRRGTIRGVARRATSGTQARRSSRPGRHQQADGQRQAQPAASTGGYGRATALRLAEVATATSPGPSLLHLRKHCIKHVCTHVAHHAILHSYLLIGIICTRVDGLPMPPPELDREPKIAVADETLMQHPGRLPTMLLL